MILTRGYETSFEYTVEPSFLMIISLRSKLQPRKITARTFLALFLYVQGPLNPLNVSQNLDIRQHKKAKKK